MSFKKPIISVLLTLVILLQGANFCVFSAGGIMLYSSFNDAATNGKPIDGWNVLGNGQVFEVIPKKDKALRLFASGSEAFAEMPVTSSENKLIIQTKLMTNDNNSEKKIFLQKDKNGSFNNFMSIDKNGNLVAIDGRVITKMPPGEWHDIAIGMNFKLKKTDVYLDGKKVISGMPFENQMADGISVLRFQVVLGSSESDLNLDDVKIYSGGELRPTAEFTLPAYNSNEIVLVSQTPEGSQGSYRIIINEDCNDYVDMDLGPWEVYDKGNVVRSENIPTAKNKSIMIQGTTADSYVETKIGNAVSGNVVFESKIMVNDFGADRLLFVLKDSNASFNTLFKIDQTGSLISGDGILNMGKMIKKQWYTISATVNFVDKTANYYLDGKLVGEKIRLENTGFGQLAVVRMQVNNFSGKSTIYLDDIYVYEGKELKTAEELKKIAEEAPKEGIFVSESVVKDALGNSVALSLDGKYAYSGNEKKIIGTPPIVESEIIYLPVRFISEAFGGTVTWDDTDGSINIGIVNKEIKIKDDIIIKDGIETKLDLPMITRNDAAYFPAELICGDVLNKSMFTDESGLIIIGNLEEMSYTDNEKMISDIYNYIAYTRPLAETVLEDFKNINPQNEHPRIMARAEDFERIKSNYLTDDRMKVWFETIKNSVENTVMDAPVLKYEKPDGLQILATSRGVLSRVQNLSMLYKITGDKRYADRAWVELENAGNFKDWNAQAHFLDTAEMATAFAIGYDWLYDYWTANQKDFLEKAIVNKALAPGKKAYNGQGGSSDWTKWNFNWNIVCNAGLAVGAMAVADKYPEISGFILENAFRSIEYILPEFRPDGGWREGPGYWLYTVSYLTYFVATLDSVLGTDYGYFNADGIDKTVYFPLYADGMTGSFNFHDSGREHINSPEMFFFANKNNDPGLSAARLRTMDVLKLDGSVKDLLWYNSDNISDEINLPLDANFGGVEMSAFRSSWEDKMGIYLGVHAGENDVTHGNLDIGDFILDALGERWAYDFGGDSYSLAGYFEYTGRRWNYYRMRAEGQNTLLINPSKGPDHVPTASSKITSFVSKPQGGMAVIDMTPPLAPYVKTANRGFRLDENRTRVVVQDELETLVTSDIWWNMQTKADIEIAKDGKTAILSFGKKKLWMGLESSVSNAKFGMMDAIPFPQSPTGTGQSENQGYHKIFVNTPNVNGKFYLTVTLIPMYEVGEINLEPAKYEPIDSWVIPDGEKNLVMADGIELDGKPFEEFRPNIYGYMVNLPYGTKTIPKINVKTQNGYETKITMPETFPGNVKIEVFDKQDTSKSGTYFMLFNSLPMTIGLPENMTKYDITLKSVSDEPQPENSGPNMLDGDLETRWSAEGLQNAVFDLKEIKKVSAVAISFYRGAVRTTNYHLEISDDGVNWKSVYNDNSSGLTEGFETVYANDVNARYVKITSLGNSEGPWVSINEVQVYGPAGK